MVGAANDLNISESGYVVFDGVSNFSGRTFQQGTGILISNADGISGNSTISVDTSVIKDLHSARYIVSPNGITDGANYTTIASAITAASTAGGNQTIFIQPGTYTENLTLQPNVNLAAFSGDQSTPNVTIVGKLTFTQAGSVSVGNIRLQTNSDYFLEITGSNASIVNLNNCFLNCTNNTGIHNTVSNTNARLNLVYCNGNLGTTGIAYFTDSSTGQTRIINGNFTNSGSSTTASTKSAGTINIFHSFFASPINISSSSTAHGLFNSDFDCSTINTTALATSNSGSIAIVLCYFASGTATAITAGTIMSLTNCDISTSNTNAISGSGFVGYSGLTFSGDSSLINVTGQTCHAQSNDALVTRIPVAYPYTIIPQDRVILVNTSSARTITLPLSPATGERHTIKDDTGSAASNNITVQGNSHNIDGSSSYVINTNYGSIDVVYNGTQWDILSFYKSGVGITTINGDSGSITGSTVTLYSNNASLGCGSSVLFTNSSTTSTLSVTDSGNNTIIGKSAGNLNLTGTNNCGFGFTCLSGITSGVSNLAIGSTSLVGMQTGNNNIAIGTTAIQNATSGDGNIGIGAASLQNLGTGSSNIAIGTIAGQSLTTTDSNNILIGNVGAAGINSSIRIGTNGTHTTAFIHGIRGVTTVNNNAIAVLIDSAGQLGTVSSSIRYKENIQDLQETNVLKLRPVSFNYKSNGLKATGLIAEEVEAIMPELVAYNSDGQCESVKYHDLPVLLLKEIQRLTKRVEELESKLNA